MKSKQTLLDQIRDDMIAHNVCPDLAKTANHLVMGEGDPDARIVFIGEAPGKNEDMTGKPFVGAAGKFLDELLASVGLKRGDVFITSIVKYRPPNNRDPKPEEKEASWPYLLRQLEVINPTLIVTLGRHSMGYFVPNVTIGDVHGQLVLPGRSGADGGQGGAEHRSKTYKQYVEREAQDPTQTDAAKFGRAAGSARARAELTWPVLPLLHPAAALYNNTMRQTIKDDFKQVPIALHKLERNK